MYSVQMQAHGQLGCVLTVDEVAEGVEIKGTELERTDMRMIRVRLLRWHARVYTSPRENERERHARMRSD